MAEIDLQADLRARFGTSPDGADQLEGRDRLAQLAARGSCRSFRSDALDTKVLETLSAVALCAPSKSDLQQRDIVLVTDPDLAQSLRSLLGAQDWISGAPSLVIFLANNRRQRQLHAMHDMPFANDHLDAFFNASVDAGIALAFFVVAAEAAGFGCCPISTIRNHLPAVRDLLGLPDHVFPVAGLAVGVPATATPKLSPRLPLSNTVHHNRFADITEDDIRGYDSRRSNHETSLTESRRGWSEAKAQQYSEPQRLDFAEFIQSIGFVLD